MTVSVNRVEDELGRQHLVFYVPNSQEDEEWIEVIEDDVVVTLEKQ